MRSSRYRSGSSFVFQSPLLTSVRWRRCRVETLRNKAYLPDIHTFPRRICKMCGMDLRYDIFERFDDGGFLWRAAAAGKSKARKKN